MQQIVMNLDAGDIAGSEIVERLDDVAAKAIVDLVEANLDICRTCIKIDTMILGATVDVMNAVAKGLYIGAIAN